jgi:hypothetical protein
MTLIAISARVKALALTAAQIAISARRLICRQPNFIAELCPFRPFPVRDHPLIGRRRAIGWLLACCQKGGGRFLPFWRRRRHGAPVILPKRQ